MACGKNCGCKKNVETQYIGDVQIDTLDALPDYILAERDVTDPNSGDTVRALVRIPAGRLFPNGTYDNVTTLVPNNDSLEIPENQVRAGRVYNGVSSVQVQYADSEGEAQFLMIGMLAGMVLIQNCGIINIPAGHDYVIGQQYYTGDNGEPVADSASGQKLFIPISKTQLAINM